MKGPVKALIFKFFWQDGAGNIGQIYNVIAECKNRGNATDTGKLHDILVKALNHVNPKLSLVFCTHFSECTTSSSKFTLLCNEKRINVYRVRKTELRSYKIFPFSEKNPVIVSNPSLICILFESNRINP